MAEDISLNETAPDGSPIAVYLHVGPGPTPGIIDGAIGRPARILELGCGVGRITHPLVALGHEVVAVDNSDAMLRHVHDARTVLADIDSLRLDERFDVVLLASHFINDPDPARRRTLLGVCKAHARPGGLVLIERYDPRRWPPDMPDETRDLDGVIATTHDIVREGDLLHGAMTYELDGRSWTQWFSAQLLDDDRYLAEAAQAGLALDAWLDPDRRWAAFRA